MRRPRATEESKARAARIARALAGLLPDEPASAAPRSERGGSCPACGASLVASGAANGVEIDACMGCGGIWLDVGELERLTADVASREDGEVVPRRRGGDEEVRYRECPRCREVMLRRNFGATSGVIVDECARHGLFLDAGELQAIEAFLRAQARAMPPAPAAASTSTSAPGRGRVAGEVVWDRLFRR